MHFSLKSIWNRSKYRLSISCRYFLFILMGLQIGCATTSSQKSKAQSLHNQEPSPDSDLVLHTLGKNLPVLTSRSAADTYVGQLVIVRGVYVDGKSPSIAGIDVGHENLNGQEVYAIGILHRFDFTKAEYDQMMAECRADGNLIGLDMRGPGVFYSLQENISEGSLAKPRPVQSWYSVFGVVFGVK